MKSRHGAPVNLMQAGHQVSKTTLPLTVFAPTVMVWVLP